VKAERKSMKINQLIAGGNINNLGGNNLNGMAISSKYSA
jgi:hypothetical protein